MLVFVEMTWRWMTHTQGNASLIDLISGALPEHGVRVLANDDHLGELKRLLSIGNSKRSSEIDFRPIDVPMHLQGKTHIVSYKRLWREYRTLLQAISDIDEKDPIILVLLSATSTAVFAASMLARMAPSNFFVHAVLHGNLNEIKSWRSRNPVFRCLDMASVIKADHPRNFRFVVLESSIWKSLEKFNPAAAARTDVIPHLVSSYEVPDERDTPFGFPLRFGLVGQATGSKGIDSFLKASDYITAKYPGLAEFYLVGMVRPGDNPARFASLAHSVNGDSLSRSEFVERIQGLHYIVLPLDDDYYTFSASGAVIDAITWEKPVIGTDIPIISDLFRKHGDIGHVTEKPDGVISIIEDIVTKPDPFRYSNQHENMKLARSERLPRVSEGRYRALISSHAPDMIPSVGA